MPDTQVTLPRTKSALPPSLPDEGYVRLPQVLAVIPVSKSTWWAGCKSGRYPAPVKLGPRTTAWRVDSIRSLIATFSA
jgi:predicted DNA-binding transcriptional regulator AlpA